MFENFDLTAVITALISLIGGGWLYNVYSAKPRRTSLEIENMKSVIETMEKSSRVYREGTDRTIRGLNEKIDNLERSIKIKDEAIYAAYDCPFPKKTSDCIVLKVYKQCRNCNIETKIINDDDNNEGKDTGDNA